MTEQRFQQIESLIEDAGRCFDPVTGLFEPVDEPGDEEEGPDSGFDLAGFLGTLGITADECAEYVQRKLHDYDEAFRGA
jgi:hypothetical protein